MLTFKREKPRPPMLTVIRTATFKPETLSEDLKQLHPDHLDHDQYTVNCITLDSCAFVQVSGGRSDGFCLLIDERLFDRVDHESKAITYFNEQCKKWGGAHNG